MPYSHHSHSGQFCKHAAGSLEEVVLEAIHQNFKVYGLSEHVPRYRVGDLYPEESAMFPEDLDVQFRMFLVEAHRLKRVYASQITLLVGAETEYISEIDLTGLEHLLERHKGQIEYLVGSIHHVNSVPIDFDLPTFEKSLNLIPFEDPSKRMTRYLNSYLDAQYTLLSRFKPEIIGHFDLCRLYNPELQFKDFPEPWSKVDRNIRYAVAYGALFELNAAAFRKGWDTAYPGRDIVDLILRLGGLFTLSDDSHGPHAVGLNYKRMAEYLHSVGVKELWYLSPSTKTDKSGRCLTPMRVAGDWWLDGFWEDLNMETTPAS